jgi:DNA invertase Pin-like site-specific DNA recombinase
MFIGYARVSTTDQRHDLQIDALKGAGCSRIFTDTASGAINGRSGLQEALDSLNTGDVLVIWKLDRLSRSVRHLVELVAQLGSRGIELKSVTEQIDTTSPTGKLIFHLFSALAELERDVLIQRTKAGLAAARAKGRIGGRPPKLDSRKTAAAKRLLADPDMRVEDVCVAVGCSKSTLYRHLSLPTQLPSTKGEISHD